MNKIISFLLVGMMTSILAGCSSVIPQTQGIKTIKIGVVAPLSGPAANYGEDAVNAYTMIINQYNVSHKNIQFQLIVEDDKALAKDASNSTQKLITVDKVKAIVGPLFSAPAVPAGILAQKNATILLTPTASAASLSVLGNYVYRFWNDEFATKKVGQYLNDKGAKKIVFIGENTDSGIDYSKGLKRHFLGDVNDIIYQVDEKDFSLVAKKIKSIAEGADYLVLFPVNDGSANSLVKAMKKEGLLEIFKNKIFSNEIIINDSAIKQLGLDIEGFKTATFALTLDTPKYGKNFIEQFKQKYEMKGAAYLLLLEAEGMSLIVDMLSKSGDTSDFLQKELNNIDIYHPRKGLFGEYYFSGSDAIGLDFVIQEIQSGTITTVK